MNDKLWKAVPEGNNVIPFKFTDCEYRVETYSGTKLFYSASRDKCVEFAAKYEAAGKKVQIVAYPVATLG